MSAIISLLFTEGTITVSFLALIGTGISVVMVFFIALGFILNTLKGIKNQFTALLETHKTEIQNDVSKVETKVKSKVGYLHFEDTIDGVEHTINVNKGIEQDHFNILNENIKILLKKLIPGYEG